VASVIHWDEEKNQLLQLQRGLSFEIVVEKLENNEILARRTHPNREKYPYLQILIVELDGYICYVPFVENDEEIFLKTIIPSRKLKKEFKGDSNEKK
jgi:uncharacterized DUF497 family protein